MLINFKLCLEIIYDKNKHKNMSEIKTISIIGAGFTGRQIAARTLEYDFKIKISDIKQEVLDDARKYISGALKRKGKSELEEKISYFTSISEAVQNADLVIETVPENEALKLKVFEEIDKTAPSKALIGTNSSSFPVSKFENVVSEDRKEKLLNLHFYPPIPRSPMVDIMRGTKTSDEIFLKGKKWIEDIECTPLELKKESHGFVFNRIWRAVKKECIDMWAGDYAEPETIDKAWKIFTGMPMGPFSMMDGIGLDVVYSVEKSYFEHTGNPRDEPPNKFKELVEGGDLGIKSGKGFYTYSRRKKK
jgi:3-hydroxybutyryl-CoA dehydrogenase